MLEGTKSNLLLKAGLGLASYKMAEAFIQSGNFVLGQAVNTCFDSLVLTGFALPNKPSLSQPTNFYLLPFSFSPRPGSSPAPGSL